MVDDKPTETSGELVVTPATLHMFLPLHGSRLAAGRLLPLLERKQREKAIATWEAHILGARRVMAERGVAPEVVAAVIATLTAETRREIAEARARRTRQPSAQVIRLEPRPAQAAGGER